MRNTISGANKEGVCASHNPNAKFRDIPQWMKESALPAPVYQSGGTGWQVPGLMKPHESRRILMGACTDGPPIKQAGKRGYIIDLEVRDMGPTGSRVQFAVMLRDLGKEDDCFFQSLLEQPFTHADKNHVIACHRKGLTDSGSIAIVENCPRQ